MHPNTRLCRCKKTDVDIAGAVSNGNERVIEYKIILDLHDDDDDDGIAPRTNGDDNDDIKDTFNNAADDGDNSQDQENELSPREEKNQVIMCLVCQESDVKMARYTLKLKV